MLASSPQAHSQHQQQGTNPGWPCTGRIDPAYVRSAEATGGVVMLFKPSETTGAVDEMSASTRHPEVVFRAGGQVPEGAYEFELPLDSTIESAYFFVSMQCLDGVSLTGPSGDELRTGAGGVESHRFAAIRLVTVPAPTPGLWKVRVAGRGFFSLIVKAATDLRLTRVTFGTGGSLVTRAPIPQRLEVRMTGRVSDVGFQLMSSSAAPIEALNLDLEKEDGADRVYVGEITPPNAEFRLAMTGTDANGFRFQRVQKQLVVSGR